MRQMCDVIRLMTSYQLVVACAPFNQILYPPLERMAHCDECVGHCEQVKEIQLIRYIGKLQFEEWCSHLQ